MEQRADRDDGAEHRQKRADNGIRGTADDRIQILKNVDAEGLEDRIRSSLRLLVVTDLAAALWDGCDAALSSRLACPEVRAAIAGAARNHDLTPDGAADAYHALEDYWKAIRPVELTGDVEQHAGRLTGVHALRGADAVHLASALAIDTSDLILAAWDRRLHAAARVEGLVVAPDELDR